MELHPNSLILVDVDNTLTLDTAWTEQEALTAKPNKEIINWVNARYLECHHIIIYTARRMELSEATKYWLKKNGVLYHAIRFNKIPCDVMIDDKTITPEQLLKEEGGSRKCGDLW